MKNVDECMVCLDELYTNIYTLPCCKKKIHYKCILDWASLNDKSYCPNCNSLLCVKDIKKQRIYNYFNCCC